MSVIRLAKGLLGHRELLKAVLSSELAAAAGKLIKIELDRKARVGLDGAVSLAAWGQERRAAGCVITITPNRKNPALDELERLGLAALLELRIDSRASRRAPRSQPFAARGSDDLGELPAFLEPTGRRAELEAVFELSRSLFRGRFTLLARFEPEARRFEWAAAETGRDDFFELDEPPAPSQELRRLAGLAEANGGALSFWGGRSSVELQGGELRPRALASWAGFGFCLSLSLDRALDIPEDLPAAPAAEPTPAPAVAVAAAPAEAEPEARTLLRQLGCDARAVFVGPRDDPERWMWEEWGRRFFDEEALTFLEARDGWLSELSRLQGAAETSLLLVAFGPRDAGARGRPERWWPAILEDLLALEALAEPLFLLGLPGNALNGLRYADLRRRLHGRDWVRLVVEFSARDLDLRDLHSRLGLTLLELRPPAGRESAHSLAVIDGSRAIAEGPGARRLIERLRAPHGQREEIGFRALWSDARLPLRLESLDPTLRGYERAMAETGVRPLAELAEVLSGNPYLRQLRRDDEGDLRGIGARELGQLEDSSLDDLPRFSCDGADGLPRVQLGDILVAAIQSFEQPQRGLRMGRVTEALVGAVPGHAVLLVRPRRLEDAGWIAEVLSFSFSWSWLQGECQGPHLPASVLRRLPIPDPEGPIATRTRELAETTRRLRALADHFEARRREILVLGDLRVQLRSLEEAHQQARFFQQLVEDLEDTRARARLTFPLPLALRLRRLEAAVEPWQRSVEISELFQTMLSLLSVMTIVDLGAEAGRLRSVRALLERFTGRRRGPTTGEWAAVLDEAPAMDERAALASSSFPELRALVSRRGPEEPWQRAAATLFELRHDESHLRAPRDRAEVERRLAIAEEAFDEFLEPLTFLARYPLRQVCRYRYDALDGQRVIRTQDLIGDQPVPRSQESEVEAELGEGVYFVDQRRELRLATPWLVYRGCPQCPEMECFVPEFSSPQETQAGGLVFRSLRTAHLITLPEVVLGRLRSFVGLEG